MKKAVVFILILVICISISVPVLEANTTGGTTQITYTVAPTYTVTIPESVTLGNDAQISASNLLLEENKEVQVKISGTSGTGNAFTLANTQGNTVTYQVKRSSVVFTLNDVVATFITNGSQSLTFEALTSPTYARTYTGSITFSVAYVNTAD